jgi:hypothetical protein
MLNTILRDFDQPVVVLDLRRSEVVLFMYTPAR